MNLFGFTINMITMPKEVAVEGFHGVVPCYLFVYARDDLFLYLLTNLQSGTVCLQLFAFGFRERSVKPSMKFAI